MFHINEGQLDLPKDWQDQSVNVFTTAPTDSKGLSFTISRDKLPWKMPFDDYAENELNTIGQSLQEFEEISRENTQVDHYPARLMEYTWMAQQGKLHQLIVVTAKEERAVIFTVTMPGILSANQRESLLTLIQSFQFRNDKQEA